MNIENGSVWVNDMIRENFALATGPFDSSLIRSYVFVNNAMIMFSNKTLTNNRKNSNKTVDMACCKSFHFKYRSKPEGQGFYKLKKNIAPFWKLSCSGQIDFPASFPNERTQSDRSGASLRTKLISEVKSSPNTWKNPFSVMNFKSKIFILYSSVKSVLSQLSRKSPSTKRSFSSRL